MHEPEDKRIALMDREPKSLPPGTRDAQGKKKRNQERKFKNEEGGQGIEQDANSVNSRKVEKGIRRPIPPSAERSEPTGRKCICILFILGKKREHKKNI